MSLSWTNEQVDELLTTTTCARLGRDSERIAIYCPAKLSYENHSGQDRRVIRGYVLNMSASGVMMEARGPLAVGLQVRIYANELLSGSAVVRHSTRRFWRFRIGLEFETDVRERY